MCDWYETRQRSTRLYISVFTRDARKKKPSQTVQAKGMLQRRMRRMFATGELRPSSLLTDVPFIGDYLYGRLQRTLECTRRPLTIRRFATRIAPLPIDQVKSILQVAMQNRRNNQCVVQSHTGRSYHVADYNVKGYESMIALLRCLGAGSDGSGLGAPFVFDARRLHPPRSRHADTKHLPCVRSRRACERLGGVYYDGLCQPVRSRRGFPGVASHTGQKRASGRRRRGRYAQAPDGRQTRWRRPGPMPKVKGSLRRAPRV